MILIYIFLGIASLFAGWRIVRRTRYFLHIFQLEGYKAGGFMEWFRERAGRVFFRLSHKVGLGVLAAATAGFAFLSPFWTALLALPAWAAAFASARLYRSDKEKKPLAYTPRMQRLIGAATALILVPVIAGAAVALKYKLKGLIAYLAGLLLADLLAPLWVLLGGFLMRPVEKQVHRRFKVKARRKLQARTDLRIVSVTGSYGKTSTKFILAELLRQRFNVLATPSSYNTPMGLCLVVNEKLKPEHQILVAEMGIRHPGDMEELCGIIRPNTGVVTTIGVAHLETMGSMDAIAREKRGMIECLAPGGTAILNIDDPRVEAMADHVPSGASTWRISVEGNEEADISASNIKYGPEGTSFQVRDDTGAEIEMTVKLLGRHNVLNLLLAVAVARAEGMRLRQIAHAARRIEPIEHRLQLRREGDITIIDDAFNSNPIGARNAMEILGQFDTGRRVVVTPGMIEMGERQDEENRTFGKHVAQNVDQAILVGQRQTEAIQAGLRDENFPEEKIKVVASLNEARSFLQTYLKSGDVVLYENDLPDQYS